MALRRCEACPAPNEQRSFQKTRPSKIPVAFRIHSRRLSSGALLGRVSRPSLQSMSAKSTAHATTMASADRSWIAATVAAWATAMAPTLRVFRVQRHKLINNDSERCGNTLGRGAARVGPEPVGLVRIISTPSRAHSDAVQPAWPMNSQGAF